MSHFDLDAFVADGEQDGEPFVFTFGGKDWELPCYIDLRVTMALERGDLESALRIMFGAEQWDRFLEIDARFDNVKWVELFRRHAKHIGESLGESKASTGSSKSTGRPSKPTSQSTTELR